MPGDEIRDRSGRVVLGYMRVITLLIVLVISAPAFAQTRLYTNADLGKPITWTRTVTPEELAALAAHQYQAPPPPRQTGPWLTILEYDPSWPFLGPPAPIQPLAPPWGIPMYFGGYGGGRHHVSPWMSPPGFAPFLQPPARRDAARRRR